MTTLNPTIEILSQKDTFVLKPQGPWLAKTAREAKELCENILSKPPAPNLIFDLSDLKEFDTSGIWLLQRTIKNLEQTGHNVKIQNGNKAFLALSECLDHYKPSFVQGNRPNSFLGEKLAYIGEKSIEIAALARDLIIFLGQVTVGIFSVFLSPRHLRFTSIVSHIERFGINAIPIVSLISIALGLVLAYQGEEQLRRFGAEIYTINLVSISVVREVGILITAILVAGRTGSSIAAQIGIMKINQEINALNALGLSPMEILIIPRILALIIVMPCLAFLSDLAGLLGGGIMVAFSLNVSPELYIHRIGEAITEGSFWIGIMKAPLFGAIIGIVSCFEGMRVKGTAESVGICTTRAVVEGIFLVTLADAFLSIFFVKIGL